MIYNFNVLRQLLSFSRPTRGLRTRCRPWRHRQVHHRVSSRLTARDESVRSLLQESAHIHAALRCDANFFERENEVVRDVASPRRRLEGPEVAERRYGGTDQSVRTTERPRFSPSPLLRESQNQPFKRVQHFMRRPGGRQAVTEQDVLSIALCSGSFHRTHPSSTTRRRRKCHRASKLGKSRVASHRSGAWQIASI